MTELSRPPLPHLSPSCVKSSFQRALLRSVRSGFSGKNVRAVGVGNPSSRARKMRTAAIIGIGLGLIGSGGALGQLLSDCKFKTCTGGTPVLHNNNGYRFETSS